MPPIAVWILVALAAVLVGAAVPALLQLRRTLKVAEETLASTSAKAERVLDELTTTLGRVNGAVDEVDRALHKTSSLFDAIGGIGDSLQKVRLAVGSFASIGTTVVAAAAGFVSALLGRREAAKEAVEPARERHADESVSSR